MLSSQERVLFNYIERYISLLQKKISKMKDQNESEVKINYWIGMKDCCEIVFENFKRTFNYRE